MDAAAGGGDDLGVPNDAATTRILQELAAGEPSAADRLFPLVYEQLRRIASAQMGRGGAVTLQPTAVVHEAYIRMVGSGRTEWAGRIHFLASAATAVRSVLIDAARRRGAAKRGGDSKPITLVEGLDAATPSSASPLDILDLDAALGALAEVSARQARLIELRYFGGLGIEDLASFMGISRSTVKADLALARAWLAGRLNVA